RQRARRAARHAAARLPARRARAHRRQGGLRHGRVRQLHRSGRRRRRDLVPRARRSGARRRDPHGRRSRRRRSRAVAAGVRRTSGRAVRLLHPGRAQLLRRAARPRPGPRRRPEPRRARRQSLPVHGLQPLLRRRPRRSVRAPDRRGGTGMSTTPTLLRPATATDVAGMLRDGRAICGGSDLLVQRRAGAPVASMIDLTAIRDGVPVLEETAAGDLRLSALHALTEITSALGEELGPLREAVAVFASTTIRNRATLGGNLANGSPAADTVPPLLVLDAVIDVVTPDGGTRAVPLADFLLGPGRVQLGEQEWIRTVTIPAAARGGVRPDAGFRKIGGRAAQAISFLSM